MLGKESHVQDFVCSGSTLRHGDGNKVERVTDILVGFFSQDVRASISFIFDVSVRVFFLLFVEVTLVCVCSFSLFFIHVVPLAKDPRDISS